MMKKIIGLIILLSYGTQLAVAPYLSFRSQGENAARELVGAGWNQHINLANQTCSYGNMSLALEYSRSFKPENICQCLFGGFVSCCGNPCDATCNTDCCSSNCCNDCSSDGCSIRIAGSQAETRGSCDWLAEYFGLPTDFESVVTFKPRITNFIADFNFYFGLDEYCPGSYFRFHIPVVYTNWDLNMCESVLVTGTNNYPAGYFSDNLSSVGGIYTNITRNNMVENFTSFANGCAVISDLPSNVSVGNYVYRSHGSMFEPLCHAKMDCCKRKKVGIADIQVAWGYNPILSDCYHAGLNLRATLPTGNRPRGEYLFEPIVGNGKHWELGVGFSGHRDWTDMCCDCNCSLFCDVNVTHLFATHQCRTFDLKCKPLSRYMLAAQYDSPVRNLAGGATSGTAIAPSKQFTGVYAPVANLTTMVVDVSSAAQLDFALMFQCTRCNWSLDLGYNLWMRSCEKIKPLCDCTCSFEDNMWGLKGNAYMYGFSGGTTAIPLSATQSKATICGGPSNTSTNSGIDNPQLAWNSTTAITNIAGTQMYTSIEPVLLSICDIDFAGARTKGLSHKLFGNIGYTRDTCDICDGWICYGGVGFEVEFGKTDCPSSCGDYSQCYDNDSAGPYSIPNVSPCGNPYDACCCMNDCCCNYCSLSQWGIWAKGGVYFD